VPAQTVLDVVAQRSQDPVPRVRSGNLLRTRLRDAHLATRRGPVQSKPRDASPHESGGADPLRPRSLRVHVADGKRVFRAERPVKRVAEDAAMREIGDKRVSDRNLPPARPSSRRGYVGTARTVPCSGGAAATRRCGPAPAGRPFQINRGLGTLDVVTGAVIKTRAPHRRSASSVRRRPGFRFRRE